MANNPKIPEPNSISVLGSGTPVAVPLPPLKPALPKSLLPLPLSKVVQLFEITLVSNVTAPVCAKTLPHRSSAPVVRVMLSSARIFPANVVVVPRTADPVPAPPVTPSSQNTLVLALPASRKSPLTSRYCQLSCH